MKVLHFLMSAALAALLGGPVAASAQAETIRVGHVDNEAHPKHLAFLKFKDLVEKASNGKITVEVYPAGQLGGERELLEALQSDAVQITCVSNGVMSAFSKPFMLLDIPFLFKDAAQARKAVDGNQSVLFSELDGIGMQGLAFWEQGFRQVSSRSKPINSMDDIKGMKLRTMEAPLHVEAWRALGANPTPMSFGQVYSSLQTGVIDGQENPIYVVTQENLVEVQKSVSLTNHIYDAMPVAASGTWWKGLSDENKKIISDAMAEATVYERSLVGAEVEKATKELAERGVDVAKVPDDVIAAMKQASQAPVIAKVKAELGDQLVGKWLASIAN